MAQTKEQLRALRKKYHLGEFRRNSTIKKTRVKTMPRRRHFARARTIYRSVRHSSAGRSAGKLGNGVARFGLGVAAGNAVANTLKMQLPLVGNIGSTIAPFAGAYAGYEAAGKGTPGIVAAFMVLNAQGFNVLGMLGGTGSTTTASVSTGDTAV